MVPHPATLRRRRSTLRLSSMTRMRMEQPAMKQIVSPSFVVVPSIGYCNLFPGELLFVALYQPCILDKRRRLHLNLFNLPFVDKCRGIWQKSKPLKVEKRINTNIDAA